MNSASWAVGVALLFGSIRAIELLRSAPKVDVVNVVVLSALAEGRGRDLDALLRHVGSSPYFDVARALAQPLEKLTDDTGDRELRKRLERETLIALATANRALRRFAWLDSLALVAVAFAGISAAVDRHATPVLALELVAATLLWLANVRGRRSLATRFYAGATALVDGLLKSRDMVRKAHAPNESSSA
jgi:hypothetical protein